MSHGNAAARATSPSPREAIVVDNFDDDMLCVDIPLAISSISSGSWVARVPISAWLFEIPVWRPPSRDYENPIPASFIPPLGSPGPVSAGFSRTLQISGSFPRLHREFTPRVSTSFISEDGWACPPQPFSSDNYGSPGLSLRQLLCRVR